MAEIREKLTAQDLISPVLDKLASKFGKTEQMVSRFGRTTVSAENAIIQNTSKVEQAFEVLSHPIKTIETKMNQLGENTPKPFDRLMMVIGETQRFFYNLGEGAKQIGEKIKQGFSNGVQAAKNFGQSLPQKALSGFINLTKKLEKVNPFNLLKSQSLRFAASLLSIRRILSYLRDTMKVAPQEIQTSWSGLKNTLSSFVNSGLMGILNGLKAGMDRLNAAFNSPAGQKFAAGMYTVGQTIGQVVSLVFSAIAGLVEFIGNNFQTIMTVASIALAVFAGYMLFSAMATLLANAPLLLLIGILAAAVIGLNECGVTAGDIFEGIGEAAAWLYALGYNLVADIWNLIADFASFFAHVFDDPIGAIGHLFVDLADFVLGILETLAGAIDSLFGSNLAGVVSGWRSGIQAWADETFGEQNDVVKEMKKLSPEDTKGLMKDWGGKFRDFGDSLSDFSLTQTAGSMDIPSSIEASPVGGSLGSDVSAIKKEVSMSEEELQSLVDMAQRQYVNQINLTAQTPIINIKGQNTGDTAQDRQALADVLRDILIEQSSAGTYRSTARVY